MAGIYSYCVKRYEAISLHNLDYHLGLKCLTPSLQFDKEFSESHVRIPKSEHIHTSSPRCRVRQLWWQEFTLLVWKDEEIPLHHLDYHLGLKCLTPSLLFDRGFSEGHLWIPKSQHTHTHSIRFRVRQFWSQGFTLSVWKVIKQFLSNILTTI